MKFGVRSVSMDDIARHLSMSKKTLYQFFKDKNEIVMLATKAHMEIEKQEYTTVFESAENAIEGLVGVNKCIRRDFKKINPSLLFDLQKYHYDAWHQWLEFKNVFIRESVSSNLKQGIKEGYFRKEIDPDLLARVRVEQVQMAFDEKIFPRDKYSLRDVQLMLFDHFVYGILTEKGRELYEVYIRDTDLTENN